MRFIHPVVLLGASALLAFASCKKSEEEVVQPSDPATVPAANTFFIDGHRFLSVWDTTSIRPGGSNGSYMYLFEGTVDTNGSTGYLTLEFPRRTPPEPGTYRTYDWRAHSKTSPFGGNQVAVVASFIWPSWDMKYNSMGEGAVTITRTGGKLAFSFGTMRAVNAGNDSNIIRISANVTQQ